jgi:hypothetical protein
MSKGFLKNIQNFKVLDLNVPIWNLENLKQLTHLEFQMYVKSKYLPKKVDKHVQLIHLNLGDCDRLRKLPKSIQYIMI